MIKIIVKRPSPAEEHLDDMGYMFDVDDEFGIDCTINVQDDASAPSVIRAITEAMKLEGYGAVSVVNCLIRKALDLAKAHNLSAKTTDFLEYDLESIRRCDEIDEEDEEAEENNCTLN